jgi:hypothetical protein
LPFCQCYCTAKYLAAIRHCSKLAALDYLMTIADALDLVIARTGVERYRYLCLEHPKPEVRAEYSALVLRLAERPPAPGPTAGESAALARAVQACAYRSIEPGGCRCAHCGLRKGEKVSIFECIQCMRNYPQ